MIVKRECTCSCVVLSVVVMVLASPCVAQDFRAITDPSKDVTLSFLQPGRIAEVLVKPGDLVSADDPLVRQDDGVEQVRLAQLKAQAEDRTNIEIAEAALKQTEENLAKVVEMKARKVATDWELREAKLNLLVTRLKLQFAGFEDEQNQRKYEEARIQVERMSMASPIEGRIEEISIERGESVRALDEVIRVVKIDPLWINVPVPLSSAQGMKKGQTAQVQFTGSKGIRLKGQIIHIAAVADAASSTRTVRVEVANKSARPAGEHVRVSFEASISVGKTLEDNGVPRVSAGLSYIPLDDNIKE